MGVGSAIPWRMGTATAAAAAAAAAAVAAAAAGVVDVEVERMQEGISCSSVVLFSQKTRLNARLRI